MVRDKQILLRVEHETRERLKAVASEHNLEVGYLLYRAALRLAYGELNPLDVVGDDRPAVVDVASITEQLRGLEAEISLLKKRVQFLESGDDNATSPQPETVEAVIVEESLGDFPKNSPLRMPSEARNEPVRMKDTRTTPKTVTGAGENDGLSYGQLNQKMGLSVRATGLRGWRNSGPKVLAEETEKRLGMAYRYDEATKKYFPMEEN